MDYCTQYYSLLSCGLWYCRLLYWGLLYLRLLYCGLLYCLQLYYTILYLRLLYCGLLYCIQLYCTILCSRILYCGLERSQSQDPVPYRFIEKVWYDIYHLFVSYQLTRNSR